MQCTALSSLAARQEESLTIISGDAYRRSQHLSTIYLEFKARYSSLYSFRCSLGTIQRPARALANGQYASATHNISETCPRSVSVSEEYIRRLMTSSHRDRVHQRSLDIRASRFYRRVLNEASADHDRAGATAGRDGSAEGSRCSTACADQ